ncbi:MAG TPA: hypothetical protein VHS74_18330 [Solirubrobacterales bacterium]|jgi:hypothetical protein|nr:hypothetical protein [Solirubrobacterales bacterium]
MLSVDADVVKAALRRAAYPWTVNGLDNGFAERLENGDVRVVSPSEDGGVKAEAFPELWHCRKCRRIATNIEGACVCGEVRWRQLAFVAYHDCGRLETPWVPKCKVHHQVRVNLPDSSSTEDLFFDCPICGIRTVEKGFPFRKCPCGSGVLSYNLHRAAVVYTARSTVIINPPSAGEAAALKTNSGRERVLEWVLGGMEERGPLEGAPTVETLVASMMASGVPEETARIAAQTAATEGGGVMAANPSSIEVDGEALQVAEEGAQLLAYATASGRTLIGDLAASAPATLVPRYSVRYPAAVGRARLSSIELLDDFPVLNASFGFTRGGKGPGESPLRWFRTEGGAPRVHGQLSKTEALLFRLDPLAVARWLVGRGHQLPATNDPREARLSILREAKIPIAGDDPAQTTVGADLLRLIHSYSHRAMRRLSSFSGIDRDSLSEYLVPEHLAFAIYAAAHGDFVLGGLQALFEHDLADSVNEISAGEHRCPLDPGCTTHGAACVACLHVGEPSCRLFNQFLDRRTLFGNGGYLV